MLLETTCPSEFQGPVMSQVTRRNGILLAQYEMDGWFTLRAEVRFNPSHNYVCQNLIYISRLPTPQVPLNDMFGYSTELRSSTQGKGEYTMEYSRYAPTRGEVQHRLIAEYQSEAEKSSARN